MFETICNTRYAETYGYTSLFPPRTFIAWTQHPTLISYAQSVATVGLYLHIQAQYQYGCLLCLVGKFWTCLSGQARKIMREICKIFRKYKFWSNLQDRFKHCDTLQFMYKVCLKRCRFIVKLRKRQQRGGHLGQPICL